MHAHVDWHLELGLGRICTHHRQRCVLLWRIVVSVREEVVRFRGISRAVEESTEHQASDSHRGDVLPWPPSHLASSVQRAKVARAGAKQVEAGAREGVCGGRRETSGAGWSAKIIGGFPATAQVHNGRRQITASLALTA